MWWCVRRKPYITGRAGCCESPHISMALSQGSLLPLPPSTAALNTIISAMPPIHWEKESSRQGRGSPRSVYVFKMEMGTAEDFCSERKRPLQSSSCQALLRGNALFKAVFCCESQGHWSYLQRHCDGIKLVKKTHKRTLSLVKWKWGEESNELLYLFKIQVADTLVFSSGWATEDLCRKRKCNEGNQYSSKFSLRRPFISVRNNEQLFFIFPPANYIKTKIPLDYCYWDSSLNLLILQAQVKHPPGHEAAAIRTEPW